MGLKEEWFKKEIQEKIGSEQERPVQKYVGLEGKGSVRNRFRERQVQREISSEKERFMVQHFKGLLQKKDGYHRGLEGQRFRKAEVQNRKVYQKKIFLV